VLLGLRGDVVRQPDGTRALRVHRWRGQQYRGAEQKRAAGKNVAPYIVHGVFLRTGGLSYPVRFNTNR
jgi:hypothetical protein